MVQTTERNGTDKIPQELFYEQFQMTLYQFTEKHFVQG